MKLQNIKSRVEVLLAFLIILYLTWFAEAFHVVNIFFYSAFILLTLIVLFYDVLRNGKLYLHINSIILSFIVYGLYSLISGIFVALNVNYMFSSLFTFFAFTVFCWDVYEIAVKRDSMDWLMDIFIVCAIVCSIHTVFWGATFKSTGVVVRTLSTHNNPNNLAMFVYAGMISLLFRFEHFYKRPIISMLVLGLYSYAIILTGSRKFFLAIAITLVVWMVLVFVFNRKGVKGSHNKELLIKFIAICIAVFGIYYAVNVLTSTSVYQKLLMTATTGQGLEGRESLYDSAFELFSNHFLFGIGYDQFRLIHGIVSHTTYGELLACSGLIGTCILLIPIIVMFFKSIRNIAIVPYESRYQQWILVTGFFVLLFLASGTIIMYTWIELLLLTCFSWIIHKQKELNCSR